MWLALFNKEFREIAPIGAVALFFHLMVVSGLVGIEAFQRLPILSWTGFIPRGGQGIPFLGDQYSTPFILISCVFIAILAVRQSAWETLRGTHPFLLHRPMARSSIFLVKILTGLLVFFICSVIPILIYGCWASIPGTHPSPFEWSMTDWFFRTLFAAPILYLGYYMVSLRPARWWGTRLFPLVVAITLFIGVHWIPLWWPFGLIAVLVISALMVFSTLHLAQERDFS